VTGTVKGLFVTSFELIVIVSLKVPVPVVFVSGVTVIVEGAAPEVGLSASQLDVLLAVQFRLPVPALEICRLCGFGFKPTAPKNVIEVGLTESSALFTAKVTGMVMGELLAPGADNVTVPEYVPGAMPDGFTATVSVAGVSVADAVAEIQDALLLAAHVVLAPLAVTFTVCGARDDPGPDLKTRLEGLIGSSVTWF
jgi:hypothetical protein